MLKHSLLPILIAAVSACTGADAEPQRADAAAEAPPAASRTASAAASASPSARQEITPVAVDAGQLPAGAARRGNVVGARRWTDALGENLIILTRTDPVESCTDDFCGWDQELYAYHYVQRDTGLALLWRTTDFIRECDLDMTVRMGHQTLEITDLDDDGTAETTFLYILACRGDVSPAEMKLIMHEGAEKYAIRGTMDDHPRMPGAGPGEMNVDPSFNRAPPAFRTFAVAHWKKFAPLGAWPEEFGDQLDS